MTNSGTQGDAAVTDPTAAATETSLLKGILTKLAAYLPASLGQKLMAASLSVAIASDQGNLSVISPAVSVAAAISGQITVTTAGTAVQGSSVALTNGVYIEALAGNTGYVYVGNDGAGDVTSANGYELKQGNQVIIQVSNLNQLWFDAATSGDKFCWLKV